MKNLHTVVKGGMFIIVLLALIVILMNGCKKDSPLLGPMTDNLSVGYYGDHNPVDNNMLRITGAKFIIRKLSINVTGTGTEKSIKFDPFVVNIDVNQRVIVAAFATVPIGSYSQLKFQIHKLNQNENVNDPEFVDSNYTWSVVVRGKFNDTDFVYKTDVNFDRNIDFTSPLLISTTDMINVTVKLKLYSWFHSNGDYINPSLPGNRSIIDQNIRNSFREVFKDNNKDGWPD